MRKQLLSLFLVIGMILTLSPNIYANSTVNYENQTNKVNEVKNELKSPRFAYIDGTGILFVNEPNASSRILGIFEYGEQIVIWDELGEWLYIYRTETGEYGYVLKRYVSQRLFFH